MKCYKCDREVDKTVTKTQLCFLCGVAIICWRCALTGSLLANISEHNEESHPSIDVK